MQLNLSDCEERLIASKLVLAMCICGRRVEAGAMLTSVGKSHLALEMMLHMCLREKLAGHPGLCDHVRWACQMAVHAARVPPPPPTPASPSFPLSSIDDEASDATSQPLPSDGCFWLNRGLLIKLLLVGQQCYDTEALSQVLEMMSADELVEAATILASSGRSEDTLPLLKHLTARHGVKRAASSPHLPCLINALAAHRRTRERPFLVPPVCKPYIAGMIVAATRSHPISIINLNAAGKRLGISLCMSQNHYLTAIRLWGLWRVRHSVQDLGMEAMCWLLIACTEVGDRSVGNALLPFMHHILLPIASVVTNASSDEAKPQHDHILVADLLPSRPLVDEEHEPVVDTSLTDAEPSPLPLSPGLGLPSYLTTAPANVKVRILGALIKVMADRYFAKSKTRRMVDTLSLTRAQVISRAQGANSISDLSSLVRHFDETQEKDVLLLEECFNSSILLWKTAHGHFISLYPWVATGLDTSMTRKKVKKVGRPPSSSKASQEVWKGALLLTFLGNLIHKAATASDQSSIAWQEVEASVASCVSTAAAAAPLLPQGRIKVMLSAPVDLRAAKAEKKGFKRRLNKGKTANEGSTTTNLVAAITSTNACN